MSRSDMKNGMDTAQIEQNVVKIEELTKRLASAVSHKRAISPAVQAPSHELYMKAATAYMAEMFANPARIFEHQAEYWGKTMKHYMEAQQALTSGGFAAPADDTPADRRFASEAWQTNPYFNFIKQQYLLNAEAIENALTDMEGLDEEERKRVEFFTHQIVDLLSPTNFLATNPDALTKAVETNGQSLIDGLENLVADIEANNGELIVNLADRNAFTVGENIATTPGKVVFRNRMLELIQYTPTTEKVHSTPIVIFPPWINKFYIMDLKEKNSLIKWIVDQGYTLFVVSWKNPDATYADVGMDTYIEEGYIAALDQVKAICNVRTVNVVGYCIAGTTLSLTLALLRKRGDRTVKSATFFTTLTDFSDRGEVGVFLSDDFVDGIEAEVKDQGILDSFFMTRTFSYLRSNDLIYGPAIKSYMMGEAPPAFDLLYWNGDGTNLPARMTVEYLRGLCMDDEFANGTGFTVCGETLHLADVNVPLCAIACETDHIAAWKSSYRGIRQMGAKDKTFILSESGHIAGIINPPSKQKYGHYMNEDMPAEASDWQEHALRHDGSWWPTWGAWLKPRSGKLIPARAPGGPDHPVLADAPGTYVVEKNK